MYNVLYIVKDCNSGATYLRKVYQCDLIKSRRIRWAGHVERMGQRRGVCSVLAGKPEGKRALGKPRRRWEENIKMDIKKVSVGAWTGSNWLRIGTGGRHL